MSQAQVPAPAPLPPGPSAPGWWQLVRYSHAPLAFLDECGRRYGDCFTVRLSGYGCFVMLSDPEAVRDVFRGDPDVLHSGEANAFLSASVGASSVLVLDGESHARQRRILLPPLKGERMRSFLEAMQRTTLDVAAGWPIGRPLRMVPPMQQITLRVILQAVLGLSPGRELRDLESKVHRVLRFGRSRHALLLMRIIPQYSLRNRRWVPFYRQLRTLDAALYELIQRRRGANAEAPHHDVLSDLLTASYIDGRPLSDQELRDAVITLLFAGHETTAVALGWALEQIIPRADLCASLQDELMRTTGGRLPVADEMDRLTLLDSAIRESLRVRTILPFVVRATKREFAVGGRLFPPGVTLCPCSHLVHRRADLYPDPTLFQADRFLERKYAGHEWFPFGGGNRTCLGTAFALYEMKAVLSTLLLTTQLERPAASRSFPVRRGIVLAPSDGAQIVVRACRDPVYSCDDGR